MGPKTKSDLCPAVCGALRWKMIHDFSNYWKLSKTPAACHRRTPRSLTLRLATVWVVCRKGSGQEGHFPFPLGGNREQGSSFSLPSWWEEGRGHFPFPLGGKREEGSSFSLPSWWEPSSLLVGRMKFPFPLGRKREEGSSLSPLSGSREEGTSLSPLRGLVV